MVKNEAEACKFAGWQAWQKEYWTEIDRKLVLERPAYDRVLKGANVHIECPTYIAISQACTRVGFDLNNMLTIIHHYAVRNELLARQPSPHDQAWPLSRSDETVAR